MVQTDWLKIKMYYCSNPSASVAEVAKKYKLAEKTVRWHANREKWLDAREEYP